MWMKFNNEYISHQELIVPPGTHELTITRYGKELWSGSVTVVPDQRVILNISNGKQVTKALARGSSKLSAAVPRFHAGIACHRCRGSRGRSSFSQSGQIDCNQNLCWLDLRRDHDADMMA